MFFAILHISFGLDVNLLDEQIYRCKPSSNKMSRCKKRKLYNLIFC